MNNKEQALTRKFLAMIDEIIFAVADQEIAQKSILFKTATEAKKMLNSGIDEPGQAVLYTYPKYKWTQYGMLEHCLKVVELIIVENKSFSEACTLRAREVNKTVPSIRQACCRVLGLKSDNWNRMAKGNMEDRSFIINQLIKKYPTEKVLINNTFQLTRRIN